MSSNKVIVIGAGLGGLAAAAFLSRSGFDVEVYERNTYPGGYACSFVRGRYEFEASLHELSGVGPPENRGSCYRLLEGCGVAEKIELLPIRDFYSSIFPDFKVTIPHGWEQAEEAYSSQFPQEKEGIRALLKWMREIYREFESVASAESVTDFLKIPVRAKRLMTSIGLTTEQAISREIKDERLKALFCDIWGYYGLPPSLLSFTLFAIANASYIEHGPYHVKGTSQALSNAFVESITEAGGRVYLGRRVEKIVVENGRATGIVDCFGETSGADFVVCNANPVYVCMKLIGLENVPRNYVDSLASNRHSLSTFNVYMGVNRKASDLGLTSHELFVNDDYDQDGHYRQTFRMAKPKYWVLTNYNHADPDFSPPGTCVLVITALVDGKTWLSTPPESYVEAKNRIARELLAEAEKVAPGLKEHIEVIEVSTPLTNIRYSANPYGSIVGYEYGLTGNPMLRLSNKGPIPGLYFANAWVRPGGGFEASMASGALAFREIMKDSKK